MNISKLELYINGYFDINSGDTKNGITMENNSISFHMPPGRKTTVYQGLALQQMARQLNNPQDCKFRCVITFAKGSPSTVYCYITSLDFDDGLGTIMSVTH